MKFKKTKFIEPYIYFDNKRRINIPGLSHKARQKGVYIIIDKKSKTPLYVGKSNNILYRTITRHFQAWNDNKQQRFTYDDELTLIRVIYTNTDKQTNILEELLLKKLKPIDNLDNKLKFIFDTEKSYISEIKEAEKSALMITEAPF